MNSLRSIIRRMSQLWNMRRLVSLVNKTIDELDKASPVKFTLTGNETWQPTAISIKEKYLNKYKKTSPSKVNTIIKDAASQKYHFLEELVNTNGEKPIKMLDVTTEGATLLESPLGFPWGWLKFWIAENGAAITFLIGLPAALGVGVGIHFVLQLLRHI